MATIYHEICHICRKTFLTKLEYCKTCHNCKKAIEKDLGRKGTKSLRLELASHHNPKQRKAMSEKDRIRLDLEQMRINREIDEKLAETPDMGRSLKGLPEFHQLAEYYSRPVYMRG